MSDTSDTPPDDNLDAPAPPPADPPPAEPAANPAPAKKKRRWPKILAWSAAVVVLLLIGLVALAPTLVSTGPGTALVAKVAQGQVNGKVSLSGLSVGWFSGTKLDEAVVRDDQNIPVVQVAKLDTGLTLWNLIRGDYALGEASLRLSLPTVVVRADGTTNLDHVFKLDEPSNGETEIPDLSGSLKVDGEVTVQYIPPPTTRPSDGLEPTSKPSPPPPVSVNFDGTKLVFGDNKSLSHTLPLALRINSQSAGTVTAVGDVDLDSLTSASGDLPTLKEKLDVQDLKLAAVSTLMTALGYTDVTLAGDFGGTLDADTTANTLSAKFAGSDIAVTQRGTDGAADKGYRTKNLTLTADGGFKFADTPATTRPAAPAGKRPVLTLDSSKFATDDLTATLAGTFDPLRPEPLSDPFTLATDVKLDVQSDFFTATGNGKDLGSFTLQTSGDADKFRKRFAGLIDFGTLDPSGRFDATLKTGRQLVPQLGPTLVMSYDLKARQIAATLPPPAQDAKTPPAPAGTISSNIPAGPVTFRLGNVSANGNALLPKDSRVIARATGTFSAADAAGTTLADGRFTVSDLDGRTGSIGKASLDKLSLPDYAALRQVLTGIVDLPEPASPVGKVDLSAAATYDAASRTLTLAEPLKVLLGGKKLASVAATATQGGATSWQIAGLTADVDLPAANALYESLYGEPLSSGEPADGRVSVTTPERAAVRFDTADVAKTLAGQIEVAVENARAQGFLVSGRVPVTLDGLKATVPADAQPLGVNSGAVVVAGTVLDATGDDVMLITPEPPEGQQFAHSISVNPVLSEFLGKYANPAFVHAAEASGLLDMKIVSSTPLNLSDLTGPTGGKVDVTFNLRDMRLVNPQIKELAGPYLSQLNAIPGVRIDVPSNLDTLEGNILDARVGLDNGTADTDITFNVADPRELFGKSGKIEQSKLTLYPLRFSGRVDLQSYAANLNVGVPQSLVEKWWPDDLKWAQSLKPKNGASFALGGTTLNPVPDVPASSLADLARRAAQDRAADEVEKRLPDQFKGLGDLLRGGGKK